MATGTGATATKKTAYDIADLAQRLKEAGLPVIEGVGEELAGIAYTTTKEWLKEGAKLSENKIDDIIVPFIDQLDAVVLPQIDKIDKKKKA